MAHFAQLTTDAVSGQMYVSMVIVVPNEEIVDENGQECDDVGCRYINDHLGIPGKWIATSYNGTKRNVYAGIGFRYDPVADVFVAPSLGENK
jgi:hypothetical protein